MHVLYVPEGAKHSGIAVEWYTSKKKLYIHGWYDSMVGIEGKEFNLIDFFSRLGITEKDCLAAFRSLDKHKVQSNESVLGRPAANTARVDQDVHGTGDHRVAPGQVQGDRHGKPGPRPGNGQHRV